MGDSMTFAWQLVWHTLTLLFNNMEAAIRASAILGVLMLINSLTQNWQPDFPSVSGPTIPEDFAIGAILGALVFAIIAIILFVIIFAMTAVAWHRFVLLNERPESVIPKFPEGTLKAYIWRSVRLGIVLILLAIPFGLIFGVIATLLTLVGGWLGALIGLVLISATFSFISLRLSIVLPAKALGIEMGLGEAWEKTKQVAAPIFFVALIIMGATLVATAIVDQLPAAISWLPLFLIDWISLMFGISILTTLYGYCVEGRELME